MRRMEQRKLAWISLTIDDVLLLLQRQGRLNQLSLDGQQVSIPEDARVVASALVGGEMAGAALLRIALESDSFGEAMLFRGYARAMQV